jgi:hypothetical protein
MSIAIPSLRGAIAVPSWAKNDLWRRARAVPSLDLRFAESKSLVDAVSGQQLITFTRASDGTFVNSAGQIEIVAANVPRFTHDPVTLESLGLLVEEQRANSIRNNTMVGAVAGTPGTLPTNWDGLGSSQDLTRTVVGTGVEDGINYVDIRWQGTLTSALANAVLATPDQQTQIVASNGQTWAGSWFVKVVGGSLANISALSISITERTSAGAFVAFGLAGITPSGAPLAQQRYSYVKALDGGATTARVTTDIRVTASSGAAIDITLRIGLPQLEQGAFATSVIPTSATAVTRSADVASITGDNFSRWFNGSEFTVFADVVRSYSGSFSGLPTVYNFYDGSDSNKFFVFGIGNNFAPIATSGGVSQLDFVTTGITQFPAPNRIAHALRANSSRIAFNGVSATEDTTVTMPIGMNAIAIGSARSNLQWNGPLRRLTFWPQALSTTTLQSITQ